MNTSFSQQLQQVKKQIEQLTSRPITLVAVSKTQPIHQLQRAIAAGQRVFGENYLQEALPKINVLPQDLTWHFIGPIQSNKTKEIAQHFAWVQTLDRMKIAEKLHEHRPSNLPTLQVLIQININHETTKSGISPDELFEFAEHITTLPRLKLRGLMAIPAAHQSPIETRITFGRMFHLFQSLQERYDIDTLSLGMSMDYPIAIEEGATMIRLGTVLWERHDE